MGSIGEFVEKGMHTIIVDFSDPVKVKNMRKD